MRKYKYNRHEGMEYSGVELGLEEYGANIDMFKDELSGQFALDHMDEVLKRFAEEGFHLDVLVNSLWSHYEND